MAVSLDLGTYKMGVPIIKGPTALGSILGSLIFGRSHIFYTTTIATVFVYEVMQKCYHQPIGARSQTAQKSYAPTRPRLRGVL